MRAHHRIRLASEIITRCPFCEKAFDVSVEKMGVECLQSGLQFCSGECMAKSWRCEGNGHKATARLLKSPISLSHNSHNASLSAHVAAQLNVISRAFSREMLVVLLFHPRVAFSAINNLHNETWLVCVGCDKTPRNTRCLSNITFDLNTVRSTDASFEFADAISFILRAVAPKTAKTVMLCALGFDNEPHRPLLCGMARIASRISPDKPTLACMHPTVPLVGFSAGVKMAEHLVHAASQSSK